MRAVQIVRLDGPSAVEVREVDEPTAGPDDVVIDVHAAGVAFPEVLQTRGLYQVKPELPFIPGSEIAGTVRRAGAASGLAAGDLVAALSMGGGFADTVVVPADRTFLLPDGISATAAAGLLFNDMTAHFALRERGRLLARETVLVHGAAGGVGTSTLRMARAFGAGRIIAVTSDESKAQFALKMGATDVVLTKEWPQQVRALMQGAGVDMVVDPVGGDRFTDSLRSLRAGGRILVVGFAGGEIPTVRVNRLLLNNLSVVGVGWGAWFAQRPDFLQSQWTEVRALLSRGELEAPEPTLYALEHAADALAALESREAIGKLVLTLR